VDLNPFFKAHVSQLSMSLDNKFNRSDIFGVCPKKLKIKLINATFRFSGVLIIIDI